MKNLGHTGNGSRAVNQLPRFLLIACALMIGRGAGAADLAAQRAAQRPHPAACSAAIDQCRLYGFARGTWDYAACRMDVRRYWTTGPCSSSSFAALHRGYCHLNPPPFI